MQTPHRPSRKQAILFFIFSLLLATGILLWVFVIDKGTLVVEGPAPFTIKAGGETLVCEISPCSLTLTPQNYTVTIIKQGFNNFTEKVNVKRWAQNKLIADMQFIPLLTEVGESVLPLETAPLRSPFLGMKKFENFPRESRNEKFSASGDKIIFELGKEVYVYYVTERATVKTDFGVGDKVTWVGENLAVLRGARGGAEGDQVLELATDTPKGFVRENIVSFKRAFENAQLFGSPAGDKVLIIENNDSATQTFYLIDIQKKSRKKIEIPADAQNIKWVGNYIAFEENKPLPGGTADAAAITTKKVSLMNSDTLETYKIPALNSENVISFGTEEIIFVSAEKQKIDENALGISFEEAFKQAENQTFGTENKETPKILFIAKMNLKTKKIQTLIQIPVTVDEHINRLTADMENNNLYFEKNKKLFTIALKP